MGDDNYRNPEVKVHSQRVPEQGGTVTSDKDSKSLTHAVFQGSFHDLKTRIGWVPRKRARGIRHPPDVS